MKYKELKRYRWITQKIKDLELEIENLSSLGAAPINDMPKGNKISSSTEQFVIRKERLINQLENLRIDAMLLLDNLEDYIKTIPNEELECLFREYFVLGMKYQDIGNEHHMDRTTVYYKIKNYINKGE